MSSATHDCPFHFTWCPKLPSPAPSSTPSPRLSPNSGRWTRIIPPLVLPPSPTLSAEKEISMLPLPFLLDTQEEEEEKTEEEVESTLFSRPSSAAPASTCSHHPSALPSATRSVPPLSKDSTRSGSFSSSHSQVATPPAIAPSITVQDVLESEDFLSLYTNEEPTSPTPFMEDTNDITASSSSSCPSDSLLFMDPSVFLRPPRETSPPPPTFDFDFDASSAYDPPPPTYLETSIPIHLNINPVSIPTPEPRPEVEANVGEEMLGEETAFISKLWHLINHPEYSRYVKWSTDGKGIAFVDSELEEFASRVLPRFFRSSKIESLIRQVNLYSFSRSVIYFLVPDKLDPSILVSVSCSGYTHPDFQRDHPEKLRLLHPKVAARKATSRAGIAKKKAARKAREESLKRGGAKKLSTPR